MKLAKIFCIVTLLLIVSAPAFALCGYCGADGVCVGQHPGVRCTNFIDYCTENEPCIIGATDAQLSAQYTVASVEVTHQNQTRTAVSTPTVAEARPINPAGK